MTITEKYGFRVSKCQFNIDRPNNWVDTGELPTLNAFERSCLNLLKLNKSKYTMIELGSNQAYYSLLFKHIVGRDKTLNIMVEPRADRVALSKSQFDYNNCPGVFYNRSIGRDWVCAGIKWDAPNAPITFSEIFKDNSIETLDMLHCDIDGNELVMLEENSYLFENGKIEVVFIATHSGEIHKKAKEIFSTLPYSLVFEVPDLSYGDSWLAYEKIKSVVI